MGAGVGVVLCREVVDLGLFVIIVVAGTLDDVRAVVGGAAEPARGQRRAAHELLHAGAGRLQQGLLQAVVGGRVADVRAVCGVRRRVRRRRGWGACWLHQGLRGERQLGTELIVLTDDFLDTNTYIDL